MNIKRVSALVLTVLILFSAASCFQDKENGTVTTESHTGENVSETFFETSEAATESATEVITEAPPINPETLPKTVFGGSWNTSHVQGIAIDSKREYMYFSFTTVLVKTDMKGNVVGTVENLVGHLGDLDYNPEDGRVYGSLEFKNKNTFYIAIFDVEKIDRIGINSQKSDVTTVVELPEVAADFTATVGGNRYRYGCSGIDGVAFGPVFGQTDSREQRLMVAYGIFNDTSRGDNDYQVILSFTPEELWKNEKKFSLSDAVSGGAMSENRYFVYTGNTNYGVQNLEYDESTGYWFMAAYKGSKSDFPNYRLFAVDGSIAPKEGDILGQPSPEKGLLLTLADAGYGDAKTGIRGWHFSKAETGIASLGGGYFYISHKSSDENGQSSTATLYKWVGGNQAFEAVK